MDKRFISFYFLFLLFFAWTLPEKTMGEQSSLAGVTSAPLLEIETALLREEYEIAKNLAADLLNQNFDSKTSFKARYYLGLSELRLGEYPEAAETFISLMKESTEPSLRDRVYLSLCDAYFLMEEYEQAFETGQQLLRLNSKSDYLSLLYLKMAKVSLKLAHWQEAREYLNKIIHSFPDSLEVPIAQQLLDEKQYFAVQVGSFAERDRAEELVAQLREKEEYAYIIETENAQKEKFYRVRVGELASLQQAQELKVKLADQGYPTQIYP